MISFAEAIAQEKQKLGRLQPKSQRADLLQQLYGFYEKDYKKEKWKEYIAWLKKNKKAYTKESLAEFRLGSYPKISVRSFCSFWLSHIPTNDLYYLVSIARDSEHRGYSFNKWLFFNLKVQKTNNVL